MNWFMQITAVVVNGEQIYLDLDDVVVWLFLERRLSNSFRITKTFYR